MEARFVICFGAVVFFIFDQQLQEFTNGELMELRKSVAMPFPAKGLGLQPLSTTGRTGIVRSVTRKKNTNRHFVGTALQVTEKSLKTVPVLWPLFPIFFAVARFAFDEKRLLFERERRKGNVGGDLSLFRD